MTYQDPNAKASWHEPIVDVRVLARSEKTGKPSVVEHYCRECGRLISGGKHV